MEIFVRQTGGLGNQLFQYAAGKYFAARYGADLAILFNPDDHRSSRGGWSRPFQLDAFRIETPMRKASLMGRLACMRNRRARQVQDLGFRLANRRLWIDVPEFRFIPELPYRRLPAKLYLKSTWQAAGYAAAVEESLRQDLRFREEAQGKDAEVLEAIAACRCPISVHLRRGDYALIFAQWLLSPSYYADAWKVALDQFEDAGFFVFSDDMEFARKVLPRSAPLHFVEHNQVSTAYQDLRLMAACRHHIIANSSFSWWGAWLNPRADKMVIAPKYWENRRETYYPDLFPSGWRLIENCADTEPR